MVDFTKQIVIDDNVYLRILKEDDANELFSLIDKDRNYLSSFLEWPRRTNNVKDVHDFILSTHKQNKKEAYTFGIYYQNNIAGVASYNMFDKQNKKAFVGYWLGEKFQGKGIMTRSVQKLCDLAFGHFKLNKVELHISTKNIASQNIAKRLGFEIEGTIKAAEIVGGNVYDHYYFGLVNPTLKN